MLAGTVDIRHLQLDTFLQTQATGANGTQADPVVRPSQAAQDAAHFLAAENDRQLVLAWRPHKAQRRPRSLQGMLVEELDTAQSHRASIARSLFLVLQVEEVLTEFFLARLNRGLTSVLGQLTNGPDIRVLGPLRQAPQLHVLNHALS